MRLDIQFKTRFHIPSFRILNPLCCGSHFNSITFIDAMTKGSTKSLSLGTKYLSLGRFSPLLIEPNKDIFRTSSGRL